MPVARPLASSYLASASMEGAGMDWQFLVSAVAFGVAVVVAALMVTGIVPGSTAAITAWSVKRPTMPRRWLAAAFWGNMALMVAAGGITVGTAGKVLSAAWGDAAQFLIWLTIGVDAAIARQRLLLMFAAVFLTFSAYGIATHLLP